MNKRLVNELLPDAVAVLKTTGVADGENQIDKNFRGQISSFGAAVATGSLLAAAAFFNEQGNAKSDRSKLMDAINTLLLEHHLIKESEKGKTLFDTIRSIPKWQQPRLKDHVLSCAVALKLAMNLYTLTPDSKQEGR